VARLWEGIMVSDGIKAARIQAQYSPIIDSTWPASAWQANMLFAVKHAAAWLNPHRSVRRPAGRHAAPGRPLLGRRPPR
jgi:hypothetical protein